MSETTPAVTISDLTVRFGAFPAVDRLNLAIAATSITAILGPNGAGKTTTLEVCEGLRRPSTGRVSVLGTNPWRANAAHRARVGVMLQTAGIPSGLRAIEAVRAAAALYATPAPIDAMVERLRLHEIGARPYRRLSGGEKQRVGLAVALVGRPDLVILDEPTSGMDPLMRQETWALLQDVRDAGGTVVVTTHHIDEAAQLADSIALVAEGQLVRQASPSEFAASAAYVVTFTAAPGVSLDALTQASDAINAHETAPGQYRVTATSETGVLQRIDHWATATGQTPTDLTAGRLRLEDIVLQLVDWGAAR